MYTGFRYRDPRRRLDRRRRHGRCRKRRQQILDAAEAEVKEIENQYASGLVTDGERYNKVVDIWSRTNDQVAKAMMEQLGTEKVDRSPRARRSSRSRSTRST